MTEMDGSFHIFIPDELSENSLSDNLSGSRVTDSSKIVQCYFVTTMQYASTDNLPYEIIFEFISTSLTVQRTMSGVLLLTI